MSWILHPVVLVGERVRLIPLTDDHFASLIACSDDPEIWKQFTIDGSQPEVLRRELGNAVLQRMNGSQYPFTVMDLKNGSIIGSTRLFDLYPEHKKLEIGWTWLCRDYWGKGYNMEAKKLLLDYSFSVLGVNLVQFKTRESNLRSKAAIEKLGARYEGTLRKDRILPDGSVRDTLVFSILNDEWPALREKLCDLLASCKASD